MFSSSDTLVTSSHQASLPLPHPRSMLTMVSTTFTCTKIASHRSRGTAVSLALSTLAPLSTSNLPLFSFDNAGRDQENFISPFQPASSTSSQVLKRTPLSDITNSLPSPFSTQSSAFSLNQVTSTHTIHPNRNAARPRSNLHRSKASLRRRRRNAISLSSSQASVLAKQLSSSSRCADQKLSQSSHINDVIEKIRSVGSEEENKSVWFKTITLEKNLFLISRTDGHSFDCRPSQNCSCRNSAAEGVAVAAN